MKPPFALTARALLAAACHPLGDSAERVFAWWADLADATGPVLLPFLTRPEEYAKAPIEELGLASTPLESLTPRRGEMWVLFCFRPGNLVDALCESALRSDGFPLILEWRKGGEDSPLLSSALRALAGQVRQQFGVDGWYLHPAFDRYGDQVDFTDVDLFSDAEHIDNVASAWGALAAGLWCVTTGRFPPEWTFPSVQWDEKRGCVAGVAGLAQKLSVAADCGATVMTVSRSQRREASGALADLREGEDSARFGNLRLHPVGLTRNPREAAAEIAMGYFNGRRRVRRIVTAVLTTVLSVLSLWGLYHWDTHRSFSKYYAAVVYHYGLPEGKYEVSPEVQRNRGSTFRFDYEGVHDGKSVHYPWQLKTLMGKARRLVRVVNVNARNVPTPYATEGFDQVPMIQVFEYHDDGLLSKVKSLKRGGDDFVSGPVEKQFSYREFECVTNGCMTLLDGDGNFWYGDVSLSQADPGLPQEGKCVINQYVFTRDICGRIVRKGFRDGRFDPVCDGDGVGGIAFEYNDDGLVAQRTNLGVDGTNRVQNQWGVVSTSYSWDESLLKNVVSRDASGRSVGDRLGVIQYSYRYDTYGNLIALSFQDGDGRATYNRPSEEWPYRFAECQNGWSDGLKRSFMRKPLPGKESLMILPPDETQGTLYLYDDLGDLTEWAYLDGGGKATTNATGISICRSVYDRQTGESCFSAYYGPDGETPAKDQYGVSVYSNVLDRSGNCLASYLFDVNGKLATNSYGAAILRMEYDSQNHKTYEIRLDPDGHPSRESSFAAVEISYKYGRVAEWRYCAGDDARTASTNFEGTARMVMRYDDAGRLVRRDFFALPGTGNSIRSGKSVLACARYEMCYDGRDHVTAVKHYDENGRLLLMPGSDHAYTWYEYDCRGRVRTVSYHDAEDRLITPGTNLACRIEKYYAENDSYEIQRELFALTNAPCALFNHPGVARIVLRYAENEPHDVVDRSYYDREGRELPTITVVQVKSVVPGGVAERVGIEAGDIICGCGDYRLNMETHWQDLKPFADRTSERPEKKLIIARLGPAGYRKHSFVFPSGRLGICYNDMQIPVREFSRILELVKTEN